MLPYNTDNQGNGVYSAYTPAPQYQQPYQYPVYQTPMQPVQQPIVVSVVEEQPQIPYAQPVEPMYMADKKQKPTKDNIKEALIPEATPSRSYSNRAVLKVGPTDVTCPNCHSRVKTRVPTPMWPFLIMVWFIVVFVLVVLLAINEQIGAMIGVFFGGFFSIALFVPCMSSQKKVKHKCPLCLYEMGVTGDIVQW